MNEKTRTFLYGHNLKISTALARIDQGFICQLPIISIVSLACNGKIRGVQLSAYQGSCHPLAFTLPRIYQPQSH